MIRAVLFDLDGVIRHFDPAHVEEIERSRGLRSGELLRIAFSAPLIDEVTTGRITRSEWVRRVGERLGDAQAAQAWGSSTWTVDADVIGLIDEVRDTGRVTGILTNGTDTVSAELEATGIRPHVDLVFNSAEIGHAKPDARAFHHALDTLGMPASDVFYTDDSPSKLAGATGLGMPTHLFRGPAGLREALREHGVLGASRTDG